MNKGVFTAVACLAAALAWAPQLAGQARIDEVDLPRQIAEGVIVYLNDPGTVRFNGRSFLPAGGIIVGDVGVLGGPFTVAGEIQGDLIVVNGDLVFGARGHVEGDVTVVGGEVLSEAEGSVGGTLAVYREALRFTERDGEIRLRSRGPQRFRPPAWATLGHSRLLVRTGGSYNRIEGLPVMLGPVWESGGANSFRFDALGIWRSESGPKLVDDELGYFFRAQQSVGVSPRITLGGTYHLQVSPISDWGVTSIESSLSTFFLHKDYRDYYEQKGWSVFATVGPSRWPLSFSVEYREEDHSFAPVSSPWTLRRNDDPWRPQPLVAEGTLHGLSGTLVWDDRNDPDRPSDGWYATARVLRGVDGSLRSPEVFETRDLADEGRISSSRVEAGFTAGFLDLRRYNRLSPDGDLDFRLVYGGSLDGMPVPSQYQQALGGEGSLPGYGLFSVDCGARTVPYYIDREAFDNEPGGQPVFPRFGCDRAFLFQAEYRRHLSFDIDLSPGDESWEGGWDWYPSIDLSPSWVAFFDVGRGWSESDPLLDTESFADVGVGFYLGDLGFYWAYPLKGDNREVNFFIRLDQRF